MNRKFMQRAIELARQGMNTGLGGPFGCVIIKEGKLIGEGSNMVTSTNDPTAHAEIVAIRNACKNLQSFQLDGCEIYTSCEPCPMCLGAIYWARPSNVFYACTHDDAAAIEFDDKFIYDELKLVPSDRQIHFEQHMREEALDVFRLWKEKRDRIRY